MRITGNKLTREEVTELIDTHVQKRLDSEKVKAVPQADDAEFLAEFILT